MPHLSVGQQLSSARSEKGLSLEQAAHLTKIRPDKLAALETDDFTAFPNNTYARGFLLIYGKFLGVDVADLASKLESANPISVEDYQYLSGPTQQEPEQRARMRPRETRAKRPSLTPLIVFIVLVVFVAFGVHFFMNTQRIGDLERMNRGALPEETTASATQENPDTVASAESPEASLPEHPAPTPETTPPALVPVPTSPKPPPAANLHELSIEPVKKSWVRIRRDDPVSEPIFDDFVYPGVGALKIKGAKFYVEVRDGGEVQLRKNGEPLAYQAPGIVVQ